jgi:hypothetical protein
MGTHPKKCRAVIVTKDGKRYLTPWRGALHTALRAAERLAARKNLDVKQIDGMVRNSASEHERGIEIEITT